MTSTQLPLNIKLSDQHTFANFYGGDNANLLHFLQQLSPTANEQFVYLWGQHASGRSHLLQACCQQWQHHGRSAFYLSLQDPVSHDSAILDGLESFNLLCLDDIESVLHLTTWQHKLFTLYNELRARNHTLITSSLYPVAQLNCNLADLNSRLQWGTTYQLKPLTDTDKIAALILRARNRGLELAPEVATYILHHAPRDLSSLFHILEKLDQASLASQRKLTTPFVKLVMAS